MSKTITLTAAQEETVRAALYFYETELLDSERYNNLTTREIATERRVVRRIETKLDLEDDYEGG